MNTNIEVMRELDELVEAARLLGVTQAKRGFGCHTDEDRRFERAMRESIDKHRAALLAERDALAAQLEDTKGARLPTWQDMLGDAEQFVRQKPTYSKYIRGTVLENDVPVWIADFAQRLLLHELTRLALHVRAAALEEAARVCEELDEEASWKEGRPASGHECAAAIREMKEQA